MDDYSEEPGSLGGERPNVRDPDNVLCRPGSDVEIAEQDMSNAGSTTEYFNGKLRRWWRWKNTRGVLKVILWWQPPARRAFVK